MKKNNTNYTKKRLALVFSTIVFLIFVFLGQIFYLSMFFYNKQANLNGLNGLILGVKNNIISIDKINNLKLDENLKTQAEINYIILDKNKNILTKNLSSQILKTDIDFMINSNLFDKVERYKNYFYGKTIVNEKIIIAIGIEKYTLINVLTDILSFAIISFFASLIIFIFLRKFINKIFLPVEENIKSMNEFVHNASHELQTPLSVIISNVDYYLKMGKTDDFTLFEIKSEAKRMSGLINSLLSLSNQNSEIKLEDVDLYNLINNILSNFENKISEKNIKTFINISKNLEINTNYEHLDICLTNIIGNAIKYNILNGTIEISFKNDTFFINDSGIGINQDNLTKIFDRFYKEDFSRNTDGFGIGLSIVKKLCEINNWKIDIKSQKLAGTTFSLKI